MDSAYLPSTLDSPDWTIQGMKFARDGVGVGFIDRRQVWRRDLLRVC